MLCFLFVFGSDHPPKKKNMKSQEPGDSIRDLFIPKRWRSLNQPLSSGHVTNHHPKKVTNHRRIAMNSLFWMNLRVCPSISPLETALDAVNAPTQRPDKSTNTKAFQDEWGYPP